MEKITLVYKDTVFKLKTTLDVELWSGAYETIPEAFEFARGYVSSFSDWSLYLEEGLEEKFYTCKKERDIAFFNKDTIKRP